MKSLSAIVISALCVTGCASSSKSVSATYVSPLNYQSLDCEALVMERETVRSKISQVAQEQDTKAGRDAAAVAVAAIVFLPAAFLLAAGEDQSGQLANLKGQFDTITEVGVEKGCLSAEELAAEQAKAEAAVEAEKLRQEATETNLSR